MAIPLAWVAADVSETEKVPVVLSPTFLTIRSITFIMTDLEVTATIMAMHAIEAHLRAAMRPRLLLRWVARPPSDYGERRRAVVTLWAFTSRDLCTRWPRGEKLRGTFSVTESLTYAGVYALLNILEKIEAKVILVTMSAIVVRAKISGRRPAGTKRQALGAGRPIGRRRGRRGAVMRLAKGAMEPPTTAWKEARRPSLGLS